MQINDEPVVIDRMTPLNYIEIWEPKYSTKQVLINPAKVGQHNKIVFSKAPSLPGIYYLSGKTIRKYKKVTNGTLSCFAVPISELRPLEINKKDIRMLI